MGINAAQLSLALPSHLTPSSSSSEQLAGLGHNHLIKSVSCLNQNNLSHLNSEKRDANSPLLAKTTGLAQGFLPEHQDAGALSP